MNQETHQAAEQQCRDENHQQLELKVCRPDGNEQGGAVLIPRSVLFGRMHHELVAAGRKLSEARKACASSVGPGCVMSLHPIPEVPLVGGGNARGGVMDFQLLVSRSGFDGSYTMRGRNAPTINQRGLNRHTCCWAVRLR